MLIGEIILYVRDMARQVEFYRNVLALTLLFPDHAADFSQEHWCVFETGSCRLCLHSGGSAEIGEDAPRLVFIVADLQAERDRLVARGVIVGRVRSPAHGVHVCDFQDPEGHSLSLESRA